MSGYTMTQGELLYSADLAGTVSVVSASAVTCTQGYPPIVVPGGYFANISSYRTSSLILEFGGLLIATSVVPTFTFSVGSSTADTYASTAPWATFQTFTPTITTGCWFDARLHFAMRTLPLQATASTTLGTVSGHGKLEAYLAGTVGASFIVSAPGPAASYSPSQTIDTTIQQYLWPSILLGAGTAGNTITMEYIKLYGQN
jgi:hypothetical protein